MVILRAIWFGFCLLAAAVSFCMSIFLACKGTYFMIKDYPDYFWSAVCFAGFVLFLYLFNKSK
jgi:hypothetical protein